MKDYTSKQRVLTAFDHREPDRVPINYSANYGIDCRLKARFGLGVDDNEGLARQLGVDFRGVEARYTGAKLHADIPERGVFCDDWGIHRRWIEHSTGGYMDFCDFPLAEAGIETIRNWPMPSPDDYDYSSVREQCERHKEFCIVLGHAGLPDIINGTSMLRSMEQVLIDLALDDEACACLIDRRVERLYEVIRRTIEAAEGAIDILHIGEDLGTQIAPLVSLDLFRKHIRPRHQPFIDLAKRHGARVIVHTCGSSSWAYPDFIEMGIDGVETLQPEAVKMDPAYLKETFGSELTLHGCISTAGPVATGTAAETAEYCREKLRILMPGGGYCFAPTHMLQDNSPTENVIAMYEAAHKFGRYA
jgi:Uroporphyrinogen-III decarboxylase